MSSKASDFDQLDGRARTVQASVVKLATTSLGRESNPPGVDETLYGTQAGFDSIALMEFILRLENEFDFSIPDADLDPEIFRSINTTAAYVLRRLEEMGSLK